jgi:hypothetical protein
MPNILILKQHSSLNELLEQKQTVLVIIYVRKTTEQSSRKVKMFLLFRAVQNRKTDKLSTKNYQI